MKKRYKQYDLPFNPNKYQLIGEYCHVDKKIQRKIRKYLFNHPFQRKALLKNIYQMNLGSGYHPRELIYNSPYQSVYL